MGKKPERARAPAQTGAGRRHPVRAAEHPGLRGWHLVRRPQGGGGLAFSSLHAALLPHGVRHPIRAIDDRNMAAVAETPGWQRQPRPGRGIRPSGPNCEAARRIQGRRPGSSEERLRVITRILVVAIPVPSTV